MRVNDPDMNPKELIRSPLIIIKVFTGAIPLNDYVIAFDRHSKNVSVVMTTSESNFKIIA